MTKFQYGEKVRIKDNPTRMCGVPVNRPELTPGTVVEVDTYTPDTDGDIIVKFQNESGNGEWAYISEDSVEPVSNPAPELTMGDRVRVYCKRTEVTSEGIVREIELRDDHKWLWIGKGYDIAADLNNPDGYEFEILERAFKWPDHEGFIRITGGPNAGQRGLARRAISSDQIVIDTDDGSTLYKDTVAGLGFDFEYAEG